MDFRCRVQRLLPPWSAHGLCSHETRITNTDYYLSSVRWPKLQTSVITHEVPSMDSVVPNVDSAGLTSKEVPNVDSAVPTSNKVSKELMFMVFKFAAPIKRYFHFLDKIAWKMNAHCCYRQYPHS